MAPITRSERVYIDDDGLTSRVEYIDKSKGSSEINGQNPVFVITDFVLRFELRPGNSPTVIVGETFRQIHRLPFQVSERNKWRDGEGEEGPLWGRHPSSAS